MLRVGGLGLYKLDTFTAVYMRTYMCIYIYIKASVVVCLCACAISVQVSPCARLYMVCNFSLKEIPVEMAHDMRATQTRVCLCSIV